MWEIVWNNTFHTEAVSFLSFDFMVQHTFSIEDRWTNDLPRETGIENKQNVTFYGPNTSDINRSQRS